MSNKSISLKKDRISVMQRLCLSTYTNMYILLLANNALPALVRDTRIPHLSCSTTSNWRFSWNESSRALKFPRNLSHDMPLPRRRRHRVCISAAAFHIRQRRIFYRRSQAANKSFRREAVAKLFIAKRWCRTNTFLTHCSFWRVAWCCLVVPRRGITFVSKIYRLSLRPP